MKPGMQFLPESTSTGEPSAEVKDAVDRLFAGEVVAGLRIRPEVLAMKPTAMSSGRLNAQALTDALERILAK